jgi:DNA repair protein RecO (recombination protein O)
MIEWRDHGVILSARPFGEDGLLVKAITREHGLHAGLARWSSRKRRDGFVLQTGVEADLVWRARIADQLGSWTIEPVRDHSSFWLEDRRRLAAISSAAAVIEAALAERETQPGVAAATEALLAAISLDAWPALYVRWEIGVLAELGFALDLEKCAATGETTNLAYVSPRTGRAVSSDAGAPYKERMLALPNFLIGGSSITDQEVAAGLKLTAHFLARDVLGSLNRDIPLARRRLQNLFSESDIENS